MLSIFISAALIGLWVVLTVCLQRIGILVPVPSMAGSGTQLLHLVPCSSTLATSRVPLARLLCTLDALLHLLWDSIGSSSQGLHVHAPCSKLSGPFPWWVVEPQRPAGLNLWLRVCDFGKDAGSWEIDTGYCCHSRLLLFFYFVVLALVIRSIQKWYRDDSRFIQLKPITLREHIFLIIWRPIVDWHVRLACRYFQRISNFRVATVNHAFRGGGK